MHREICGFCQRFFVVFLRALLLALAVSECWVVNVNANTQDVKPNEVEGDLLTFENFHQRIELVAKDGFYLHEQRGLQVSLSGQLLVKLSSQYSSDQVKHIYSGIKSAKLIYAGKTFCYYLVDLLDTVTLNNALAELQKIPAVKLVQPDLLQVAPINATGNSAVFGRRLSSHGNHSGDSVGHDRLDSKQVSRINLRYKLYLEKIGVIRLWQRSLGAGIKIALIDDGFDLTHPEFQHLTPLLSYDVDDYSEDARPKTLEDTHGTKLAGVLFSNHQTGILNGIAPKADLIAVRNVRSWTSHSLLGFQVAQIAQADIINCSWQTYWLLEPVLDVIQDLTQNGRNGKGTVVIFAAGNQGQELLPESIEPAIAEAFVVGANNVRNQRMKYSNYGDLVDFNSYGMRVGTTASDGQYTDIAGTSLAAVITSGLSALLLSLEPNMTLKELNSHLHSALAVTENPENN